MERNEFMASTQGIDSVTDQDSLLPMSTPSESKVDVKQTHIEKAIRFWNHPSLRDVPLDQKKAYLYHQGVTDDEMYAAWDRIVESAPVSPQTSTGSSMSQPAFDSNRAIAGAANTAFTTATSPSFGMGQMAPPPPGGGMYHHSTNPQYSSMYPNRFHEEDDEDFAMTFAKGASLVSLGGLLGLSAAAAVRWLNGGDFRLLPPPSLSNQLKGDSEILRIAPDILAQESCDDQYSDGSGDDDDEDDDTDDEDNVHADVFMDEKLPSSTQNGLVHEVQQLSETLRFHVSVQEKILNKLSSSNHSSITDHSMNLLKSTEANEANLDTGKTPAHDPQLQLQLQLLWAELVQIRAQLSNANPTSKSRHASEHESDEPEIDIMTRLDDCIKAIQDKVSTDTADTKDQEQQSEKNESPPKVTPNEGKDATEDVAESNLNTPSSSTRRSVSFLKNKLDSDSLSITGSVRKMVTENDAKSVKVAAQLMYLYIINLSANQANPRYKKIFTTNESFQKVHELAGGRDFLKAVGFEDDKSGNFLSWPYESKDQHRQSVLSSAAAALSILKSAAATVGKEELLRSALQPLSAIEDDNSSLQACAETPVGTTLMSPPVTKKHPYIPPSESPQMSSWSGTYLNALSENKSTSIIDDETKSNHEQTDEKVNTY